jgi:hypothetical protein
LAACGRVGFDASSGDASIGIIEMHADGPGGDGTGDSQGLIDGMGGPHGPWQLIQSMGAGNGGSPASSVTIQSSAAGSLIVVAVEVRDTASSVMSITDNVGNTYHQIPNGVATDTAGVNLMLELRYAYATTGGVTTVTSTSAPTTTAAIVVWEFANVATGDPLDHAAPPLNNGASTLTPMAPPITTTQDAEIVISATLAANTVTGIHAGNAFTNDSLAHANGWGHLTNPQAPAGTYQAVWDVDLTSTTCAVTVAFFAGP